MSRGKVVSLLILGSLLVMGCDPLTSSLSSESITSISSEITSSEVISSSSSSSLSESSSSVIIELDTRYTDEFKLDKSYLGKEFIAEGIGAVTLAHCTDGDTASFRSAGTTFSVRFLGLDTPESTAQIEPWGRAAARFTCGKLSSASLIVLEAEGDRIDSTGSRYLGWVWYGTSSEDLRLLNLELIEEAYSPAKGLSTSRYADAFYTASLKTQQTHRRVWGEEDPEYDYSNATYVMTIAFLRANYQSYFSSWVILENVLVTRRIGGSFYLQDESGEGIYVYPGYVITSFIKVGDIITLQGKPSVYSDEVQLVDLKLTMPPLVIHSRSNPVVPLEVSVDTFGNYPAQFVQINNLTVTSVGTPDASKNYNVYAKDSMNRTIQIRFDGDVYPAIPSTTFVVGKTYNVAGIVGRFMETNQLMITLLSDITLVD